MVCGFTLDEFAEALIATHQRFVEVKELMGCGNAYT